MCFNKSIYVSIYLSIHMSHVLPLCYCAKYRHVDISCKSSRIWEPLAFADMIREVLHSCRNLVLQRRDPLLSGRISTCGYLLQIECQIQCNWNQCQTAASGLCWHDQGTFKELQKPHFAKGGAYELHGPWLAIGPNFDVRICHGNCVPNNQNLCRKSHFAKGDLSI